MSNQEYTRVELQSFAESRGGQLLSQECNGAGQRLRWRCGREHEFEASPRLLILGGYWCPDCFPSLEKPGEWDYEIQKKHDPLLRSFIHDEN